MSHYRSLLATVAGPATSSSARAAHRGVAVLTPLLVWLLVSAPVWAGLFAPRLFGYFLVVFAAYWVWRSAEFAFGLLVGLWRLRTSARRDWSAALATLPERDQIRHLVLLPTYREGEEVLAETLGRLAEQTTPLERVAVVLAFEERDPGAPERARRLTQRFASLFGEWLVTFHPHALGEVMGKSSNLAWAACSAERELIATGRFPGEHLLVTVCDADSRLDQQYLAALTHAALSHPDGRFHIYQPAIMFYANHWRLPVPLRALNTIFSLYALARMATSHRLVPQSTYSLSWFAARAVGFWDVDVIPEDSHMFFKVWLHLGGRVRTRPIYLPVYADAAEGHSLRETLATHYVQIRRWAWGVADIPYVVLGAFRAHHIPRHVRAARVGWYVEEHLVWPTHWFILTLGGALPPLLNPVYAHTAEAIQHASAAANLLAMCSPVLGLAVVADAFLRPRTSVGRSLCGSVFGLAGFAALPVTGLALSALPALDAHTRVLLGRPLVYQVTEKLPPARGASARVPVAGNHAVDREPVRALARDAA